MVLILILAKKNNLIRLTAYQETIKEAQNIVAFPLKHSEEEVKAAQTLLATHEQRQGGEKPQQITKG